jgi:hypothetical protein
MNEAAIPFGVAAFFMGVLRARRDLVAARIGGAPPSAFR